MSYSVENQHPDDVGYPVSLAYEHVVDSWKHGDHLLDVHLPPHPQLQIANYWACLDSISQEDVGAPISVLQGHDGMAVHRVVGEMKAFYKKVRGQTVRNMPYLSHPASTDSVAYFKYALMHLCTPINCTVPVPKIKFDIRSRYAFWQRIALSQLRHNGKKKRYMVLYSSDKKKKLAIWHIPGLDDATPQAWLDHASRQVTYLDDDGDNPHRARRIKPEVFLRYGLSMTDVVNQVYGHELKWLYPPSSYLGQNSAVVRQFPNQQDRRSTARDGGKRIL